MGGSGRKRKREEKAKTQLKKPKTAPGKHLPKGTNETKTQFKTAKIIVPGQATEAQRTSGPVTNKKLNLKDVLAKLSHFSLAVRTDGLEGLKELVTGSSAASLITGNLASILTSLVPLTGDRERKLRKLANTNISAVLSHAPESSLNPLHALLSAHLCCALTHIDPRIQLDALDTLDCLLINAPNFIRTSVDKILPNCLDQISSKKKSDEKKSGPFVAENVSETMSSLKWRNSVLSRIDRILEIVFPSKSATKPAQVSIQEFVAGKCYPLTRPIHPVVLPLSALSSVASTSSLQQQALLILPLLIETWVEARASDDKKKSSVLHKEVAELLLCVAGILDKLIRMLDDKTLQLVRTKFGSDIISHFFPGLPYSCPELNCNEANVQLTSLSFELKHQLQPKVIETILKSKGAGPSASLRLIKKLLKNSQLRSECVSSLVRLLDIVEGQEREEVTQLLKDQAVHHPIEEVLDWVRELPTQLLNLLQKSENRDDARGVLDSCLALAKTKNSQLAASFLLQLSPITGCIQPEEKQLLHLVSCVQHHCEKT